MECKVNGERGVKEGTRHETSSTLGFRLERIFRDHKKHVFGAKDAGPRGFTGKTLLTMWRFAILDDVTKTLCMC